MTDEQIHLYAVARTVVPIGTGLSTICDRAGNGLLYTLVLYDGDQRRWFAMHSRQIRYVDDERLRLEIARAVSARARDARLRPA